MHAHVARQNRKFDVLLVQRADTSFYPPTIHQANLLSEAGLEVVLLDGGKTRFSASALNPAVTLVRPLVDNLRHDNLRFYVECKKLLKACAEGVCISYDAPASTLVGLLPYSGRKMFHFHEYPNDKSPGLSWYSAARIGLFDRVASFLASKVDAVSMADSHRASAFFKENRLPRRPIVVNNCPRRMEKLPSGILRQRLRELGVERKHVVLFQGSISTNYYVDQIVRSMRYWPSDAIMAFVGPVRPEVRHALVQLAEQEGVGDRVLYIGQVPYADLFQYTVDADIAFTMIKPVTFNFMHMAGASNKRYEAMTCGVPQITNHGPGMTELVCDNGIGICVTPENAQEVGAAVTDLLRDSATRRKMASAARRLHMHRFNYESQFHAMRELIVASCHAPVRAPCSPHGS
jgi:glycosyltransferase involved in cell wall biosynthesis